MWYYTQLNLIRPFKKGNSDICDNMDEPGRHYAMRNKLAVEGYMGFPGNASGRGPTCKCKRCKRCGFSLSIVKIPCSRAWQLILVF